MHSTDYAPIPYRNPNLPSDTTSKCSLRRVRLDSQGYDPSGRYWGAGAPLWLAEGQEGEDEGRYSYVRAASREEAKHLFPKARWYR